MPTINRKQTERGDTLIEVLVAITVFGVVVVGAFSLMNRGVAQMYDSMERSEVRLLLNGQIEALTYARDQYLRSETMLLTTQQDLQAKSVWESIRGASALDTGVPALDNCTASGYAFSILHDSSGITRTTSLTSIASGFPSPGNGIWIEQINSPNGVPPYKDFYVRACWAQSSSAQLQVLSTVVRLYDDN